MSPCPAGLVLLHRPWCRTAPALSKGASLLQRTTKVSLDWNNSCPSGKQKLLKVWKQVHHRPRHWLKSYPLSKTCPSLDFYHWLFKEMWNLLQGLRCILRTLASMPKPVMELHWCWQVPGIQCCSAGCQDLLCEGCFLKKDWSLDRGFVLLQFYTAWEQDMAKGFLGSKEYSAHQSSGKL